MLFNVTWPNLNNSLPPTVPPTKISLRNIPFYPFNPHFTQLSHTTSHLNHKPKGPSNSIINSNPKLSSIFHPTSHPSNFNLPNFHPSLHNSDSIDMIEGQDYRFECISYNNKPSSDLTWKLKLSNNERLLRNRALPSDSVRIEAQERPSSMGERVVDTVSVLTIKVTVLHFPYYIY